MHTAATSASTNTDTATPATKPKSLNNPDLSVHVDKTQLSIMAQLVITCSTIVTTKVIRILPESSGHMDAISVQVKHALTTSTFPRSYSSPCITSILSFKMVIISVAYILKN